jgi:hypothetical protein
MSIETADRRWDHLYPPFRTAFQQTLARVAGLTGAPWALIEGYRSPERQLWLYAQGRTRPGPIVTWMKSPKWHGTGLAADAAPTRDGRPWYGAPRAWWQGLLAAGQEVGLSNPAWSRGDLGHLQLSSAALRQKALAWCRAGFPPLDVPQQTTIRVLFNGEAIPDALPLAESGRVFLWVRPLADAADAVIVGGNANEVWVQTDDAAAPIRLPMRLVQGKGFVWAGDLTRLGWQVAWDAAAHAVIIAAPTPAEAMAALVGMPAGPVSLMLLPGLAA